MTLKVDEEVWVAARDAAGWREVLRALLDANAVDHHAVRDFDESVTLLEARRELMALFATSPNVDRVLIRINGEDVGVAPRDKAGKDPGVAGTDAAPAGLGASDGATLPGDSSEYRLVQFRCHSCGRLFQCSYFDERFVPECVGHGRAVLQR